VKSSCYFVAESEAHAAVLRQIFRDHCVHQRLSVFGSSGGNAALSKARSVLTGLQRPVGLVADADSVNPARVVEREDYLTESLGSVAPVVPRQVFMAIPEFEVCLFDSPELAEAVFGGPIDSALLEKSRFIPKKVLEELAGSMGISGSEGLIRNLSATAVELLRNTEFFRRMDEFVSAAAALPA